MKPITKELVDNIHAALDKGLVKGLGIPVEGQMCVEALICYRATAILKVKGVEV